MSKEPPTLMETLERDWQITIPIAIRVYQHIFTPEQILLMKGLFTKGWDAGCKAMETRATEKGAEDKTP